MGKQQVLNLSQSRKTSLFSLFRKQCDSRIIAHYLYDPYYNNCATKLRDISMHDSSRGTSTASLRFINSLERITKFTRALMRRRNSHGTLGEVSELILALGNQLDANRSRQKHNICICQTMYFRNLKQQLAFRTVKK